MKGFPLFKFQLKEDEETNSISIHELILYGLCLIIICAISFGRTNDSTYYYTNMLTKAFVTSKINDTNSFTDIAQNNGDDFWKAIQGPIFARLYNIHTDKSNTNYGSIFNENKILGVARLRQVRVKPNSCKLHHEFAKRNLTQQCYAAYTVNQEDQNPFGNPLINIYTSDAWSYTPADVTGTPVHKGMVSQYSGGGYVQLLTRDAERTMEILQELKRHSWINRGTRAIFFDVIVYNPNINLFCHIRLLAEYPSSGGAIPSTLIRAVKLIQYTSSLDYITLACELIFTVIVILQIIECLIEIIQKKYLFLFNIWNLINIISIIFSLISILYELLIHFFTRKHLNRLLQIENHYPNFNDLFTLKLNSDFYLGLTLAFTWLKIFKYLTLNKTMLLLNKTISSCLNELIAFTCIFLIIFLAYTQFGWLFFGRYLTEWRSFPGSMFTLFRIIIGDFDFYAMLNIDELLGPLFLFTYIYFVYFVLLNMFLAIINETYSRIVSDTTLQTYYIRGFTKKNSIDYQKKSQKHDSTDVGVKDLIDKNQVDHGNNESDINTKLSYDEYLILNQYVDEIENQITDYINKIEEILHNLDDLHETTIDRKEILNNISKKFDENKES